VRSAPRRRRIAVLPAARRCAPAPGCGWHRRAPRTRLSGGATGWRIESRQIRRPAKSSRSRPARGRQHGKRECAQGKGSRFMVIASMPGCHAGSDRLPSPAAAIHAVGAASHQLRQPGRWLAPVLQRLVAPALILFERGGGGLGGPLRHMCYGIPIIDVHPTAPPAGKECMRQRAARREKRSTDEPRKPRGESRDRKSTDFKQVSTTRRQPAGLSEKSRGGRSDRRMKPLNAGSGGGVKQCRSGMMTNAGRWPDGSADAARSGAVLAVV